MPTIRWSIILLGVAASLALAAHEAVRDHNERHAAFRAEVEQRTEVLEQDIANLGSKLARIDAFYAAAPGVAPHEFDRFEDALAKTDPPCGYCLATGWVPDSADNRKQALIK